MIYRHAQQDALLHAEDRIVVLIGATTEKLYFEVTSALISRSCSGATCIADEAIDEPIQRALESEDGSAGAFVLDEDARKEIATLAGGDGRAALNFT